MKSRLVKPSTAYFGSAKPRTEEMANSMMLAAKRELALHPSSEQQPIAQW